MEFFDNAVDKAKDALNIAYKKTGEVVNTQKQKFDAASLKNKCCKDYEALGKIYFELVKDKEDNTDNVQALVDALKEKLARIDEINAEIQNAKNKRVCPSCGAFIDNNSIYCNNCGIKLTFDNTDSE